MKVILLMYLISCSVILSSPRLIDTATDRTLTTETKTTPGSTSIRLTRQVNEEELLTGNSKEDFAQGDESVPVHNRRVRQDSSPNPISETPPGKTRNFNVNPKISGPNDNADSKTLLVKKPIPKYIEMDYDDDFQMKVIRSPIKHIIESGEHEDDDFNLDDYEFDVNHDEYVGRGKPLEPRMKHKEHEDPEKFKPIVVPDIIIKTTSHRMYKRQRSITVPKGGDKEDYYDDKASTSMKPTEKMSDHEGGEDFNVDVEESKEYETKTQGPRIVRSPSLRNGNRGSPNTAKVLSILPMFPQIPDKYRDYKKYR